MDDKDSLVRARYAVSVLRVAQKVPRAEAIKLIEGLSKDWLNMESNEIIFSSRAEATNTFEDLATALQTNSPTLPRAWDKAANAAARWLAAVEQQSR